MAKVVAVFSVYNVQALIERSMTSCLPFVDAYLVMDGRYIGFKCPCGDDHDNSCDGTELKVRAFAARHPEKKVDYVKVPALHEFDKRQLTLDRLEPGDVGIVIDDDELLYGDPAELRDFAAGTHKLGCIPLLDLRYSVDLYPRVHRKTPGLRYRMKTGPRKALTYEFDDDEGPITDAVAFRNLEMVELVGDGVHLGYRELARDAASLEYDEAAIRGEIKARATS